MGCYSVLRHSAWILLVLVCLDAVTARAADITSGLHIHYTLEETSGTVATDVTGGENGAYTNFAAALPSIPGVIGNGINWGGGDDQVIMPIQSLDRALTVNGNRLTMAVWFKTAVPGGILGYQNTQFPVNASSYVPALYVGTDGLLRGELWHGAVNPCTSPFAVNDDLFHHAVLTIAPGQQILYVDGIQVSVQNLNNVGFNGNNNFTQLGMAYGSGWTNFPGTWSSFIGILDDFRVYDRTLSAEDIVDLYNVGLPVTIVGVNNASAGGNTLQVTFNKDVTTASAQNLANYTLNGGLNITGAVLGGNLRTVTLTLSGAMLPQVEYALTVSGIQGRFFNAMTTAQQLPVEWANIRATNQALWLKADLGISSTGTAVQRWYDQSGAFNVGQALNAVTTRPTFTANSTNSGKPSLAFDGGDSVQLITGVTVASCTFIAFARPNNTATDRGIFGGLVVDSPGYRITIADRQDVVDSGNVASPASTTAVSTTQFSNLSAAFTSGATVAFRLNGAADGTVAFAQTMAQPVTTIGNRPTVSQFFNGNMAEGMIYSAALTPAESTAVEAYLNNKYNKPYIAISALDATADENGAGTGIFRVSRTGITTNPLTVPLTVAGTATLGTDYLLNGAPVFNSVIIPAGQSFVDITVTGLDDPNGEPTETVDITVAADVANYNRVQPINAVVNLADDEAIIALLTLQANASERGPQSGIFQLTRTNNLSLPLTITYTRGGTAANGGDYQALSGTVNMIAGQTAVTLSVDPIADALAEGAETVILTVNSGAGYYAAAGADSGTVTIEDRSVVTVQASDPDAYEVGVNPAVFTLTRTGPFTLALTVPYTLTGTAVAGIDYVAVTGSVTFAIGESTATVTITPIDDDVLRADTNVTLTLNGNADFAVGTPGAAAITIHTDPEIFSGSGGVTIAPNPALAGQTVTYTGSSGGAVVVNWLWSFGDGSTATGQQTTHVYTNAGEYEVTISATFADGSTSVGRRILLVATPVDPSIPGATAVPPTGGGLLIGGSGITKLAGGKLKIRFSRRQVVLSGKLGNLNFAETLGQSSLQGRQGMLSVGPENNRRTYFFVLDAKGRGASADVPKIQINLKKRSVAFTVAEAGLTEFLATLGASRAAPSPVVNVPITVRLADKVFLAFTLTMDFKARGDNGSGTLRKR